MGLFCNGSTWKEMEQNMCMKGRLFVENHQTIKSDFQVVIVIFSPISGLAGGLNTMLPYILQNLLVS